MSDETIKHLITLVLMLAILIFVYNMTALFV